MGLFDFVKKKIDASKKENEWPYYDPAKRIDIPDEVIDAAQRVWASDGYCEKVYKKFYSDFPEKPYISKDREIYTNWFEEMDSLVPHELVDIAMMKRFSDGLLPGEVYMLYWIDELHRKRIPSYFEYKYGIEFVEHRSILLNQGYLDSDYQVTDKGRKALQKHKSVLPEKINKDKNPESVLQYQENGDFLLKGEGNFVSYKGKTVTVYTVGKDNQERIKNDFELINELTASISKKLGIEPLIAVDYRKFVERNIEKQLWPNTCILLNPLTKQGNLPKNPVTLHFAYADRESILVPARFGKIDYGIDNRINNVDLIAWEGYTHYCIAIRRTGDGLVVKKVEKCDSDRFAKTKTIYQAQ